MKRIKSLLFIILLLVPLAYVNASGSVTVSPNKLTVEVGKTSTFTIKASNAAGRVDITSSDTSIATVSTNSQFLDNSSVKIKVSGKKEGTVTITVKLKDVGTYDGDSLTGNKTISVTVKKAAPEPPKIMKITKLEVVGYDIDFKEDKTDYIINVASNVSKVYVLTGGENYTVSGDKSVNIAGIDSFKVTFTNGSDKKEYVIKVNRVAASEIQSIDVPKEPAETKVDTNKKTNIYLYATIGLGLLCLILVIALAAKKKNKKDETPKPIAEKKEERFMISDEKMFGKGPAPMQDRIHFDKPDYIDPADVTANNNPVKEEVTPIVNEPNKTSELDVPEFDSLIDISNQRDKIIENQKNETVIEIK